MDIALVACAKTKALKGGPAVTLYTSPLYRKSMLAALDRTKAVRILSAMHGVLELGDRIEPYEKTLKNMPRGERQAWGAEVSAKLALTIKSGDRAHIFGGEDYTAPLRRPLYAMGVSVNRPLGDRSLGSRLQYLREINGEEELAQSLKRFQAIMKRLSREQSGGRSIAECTGRAVWPERGVYLIVEDVGPKISPQITRVGTHAVSAGSKTSLWDRISTHRGAGHGGGSHRSSIFRSHIGRAIARKNGIAGVAPATWGVGQSASVEVRGGESEMEKSVSRTIGAMKLMWLDVGDTPGPRSDRAYLERNIIGLLSRANFLGLTGGPDEGWLGSASDEWRIAASGLWNLDHLFYRPDAKFLGVLERYVDATVGRATRPLQSIAPSEWGQTKLLKPPQQLSLFPGGEL